MFKIREPCRPAELTRKGYHWARARAIPGSIADDIASVSGANGRCRCGSPSRAASWGPPSSATRSKIALRLDRALRDAARAGPHPSGASGCAIAARRRSGPRAADRCRTALSTMSADGIPGLVADRYGPVAVLQTTIAGTERLLPVSRRRAADLVGGAGRRSRETTSPSGKRRGSLARRRWSSGDVPRACVGDEVGPLRADRVPRRAPHRPEDGRLSRPAREPMARRRGGPREGPRCVRYQGLFALHCRAAGRGACGGGHARSPRVASARRLPGKERLLEHPRSSAGTSSIT